ncbi:DUF3054 domain-containing protein [Pseudarthrobacter sp. N5]|uniref:DUF3054 domain-containing protein n=1 Tax=Pseudarthrobacter sp. N5 TaxID=3418416 RepID=UPI003CF81A74
MPSNTTPPTRPSLIPRAVAGSADVALILVFAAIGRDAHARGDVISGVLLTAWPFLTGAAVAWLVFRLWNAPLAPRPAGIAVWLGAVTGGMILRALTAQTVVLPFVIVALLSLGVSLIGYRLLLAGFLRLQKKQRERRRTG